MAERIVVRQDSSFMTEVLAANPHELGTAELHRVDHIHQLTPYGMLMVSLASCTGIVLHTYAQHHGIKLDKVEMDLHYNRLFAEDCADCPEIEYYEEHIDEEISLRGELSDQDRERLFRVSRQCPIHKILADGMDVDSYLTEE